MFSTIVHPTDFSDESIPALKASHELAKQLGAKLLICFIAHPPLVAASGGLTNPTTNETRNIEEELNGHHPGDPSVNRELRVIVTEHSTRVKTLLGMLEENGL